MRALAQTCIKRPVFASMLILALLVVGAAAYGKLGVDRFPSVDVPTVRVMTRLPGASPTEVETQVSQVIEEAVNAVAGIKELRSISGPGQSMVLVSFELGVDIDVAAQDVRDRVASSLRDLPREVDPPMVSKVDNDLSPVMSIVMSGDRPIREITEWAKRVVKIRLERSSGVAEVEIVGGRERSINIWVDPARMEALGVPITQVRDALERQNVGTPAGNVSTPIKEYALRTLGKVESPAGFQDLAVGTAEGSAIRIGDIGEVEDGNKEPRSYSRRDGRPAVTLEVRRQSGANTVAVIEGIKARMAELQAELPPDILLEVQQDQSNYIYNALHEITLHLVLGSVLASLVVFAFMRDWRATVIAAVAIPTSVVSTFGMMKALGFTLNSVTMLALVLMVGVVIDDAIVVLENIHRQMEKKRLSAMRAAVVGTEEIALAVLATTFSLVVIFVPVSFMSSISGKFLFQFGITAAAAVLVSLLVSFTLTPMMCSRMLRAGKHQANPGGGFYGAVERNYLGLLRLAMRHRGVLVVGALLVVAGTLPMYRLVKQEYVPTNVDEGEFEVRASAVEGTSVGSMDEAAALVEAELKATPGVRAVLTTIGGGFLGSVNSARFYVRMAPHEERLFSWSRMLKGLAKLDPASAFEGSLRQADVMKAARARLAKLRGLRCSVSNVSSFSFGGSRWDIDFVILGPDLEVLLEQAESLRARSAELGIVDADTTLKLDKPELRVVIDRERAASLEVDVGDIAGALRILVGGEERVTRFYDENVNDSYDVALRLREEFRNNPAALGTLLVANKRGVLIRLDNLVQVEPATTASRIDHLDRQRQVALRGGVAPGYALADRLEALRVAADELELPAGYSTRVAGKGRELETTFTEFLWAFALSVVFMYLILASQFESTIHPFTILLSLPLCVPFALFSLWVTGNTLNLYSALGLLVLFGVVKKNAILQIDHMNQLIASGMERHAAIMQANRDRLRPILMTTLTLVAGMIPLALGNGPGAEERRTIAVVVIGGQSLSLLLTLLVTPVVYSLFDDLRLRLGWGAGPSSLGRQPAE